MSYNQSFKPTVDHVYRSRVAKEEERRQRLALDAIEQQHRDQRAAIFASLEKR
jgi:hypothetical protein